MLKDEQYYCLQYEVEWLRYEFSSGGDDRLENDSLLEADRNFEVYYYVVKLETYCHLLARQRVSGKEIAQAAVLDLLERLKLRPDLTTIPIVQIFYFALLLLLYPERTDVFTDLKHCLKSNLDAFSLGHIKYVCTLVQNYCIRRVQEGKTEFLNDLFELYDLQLKKRSIYLHGYLLASDFKNIVATAVRTQRYNWAGRFVENYKDDLLPDIREDVYHFCLATLAFANRDYPYTLSLLTGVRSIEEGAKVVLKFDDKFFKLDAYKLRVKAAYELLKNGLQRGGLLKDLEDINLHNVKRFMNNHVADLSVNYQESYRNFVVLLEKIIHLSHERYKVGEKQSFRQACGQLVQTIRQTPHLNDREWLLLKVEELVR